MFPLLARFCSSKRMGKALVGRLWLDVTKVMASKRSKKENIRLPVAVRGSRSSVLKLPDNDDNDDDDNDDDETAVADISFSVCFTENSTVH